MPAAISKKPSDRTHEENQERAYIAASRRSDRSVEARVESARRASEIHKRRTGKALKVTEKDVLAEEMYEEEDDELPSQYQNLNAHLQTGSIDFDARLQAYLANAVAFRKALSGVASNRDKTKNVDFVNTKQLADHQALFPKHSDAWKDIIIPKSSETSNSPFLPQGTPKSEVARFGQVPYDSRSSSLSHRRASKSLEASDAIDFMGTLRASDLKPRTTQYRPAARHPSMPRPKALPRPATPEDNQESRTNLETAGINYASLDISALGFNGATGYSSPMTQSESPFSSRLPANALEMLAPMQRTSQDSNKKRTFGSGAHFHSSFFDPKPQDTINATLAPASGKAVYTTQQPEYQPQLMSNWSQTSFKESSASRKIVEDNMWGNFIDDSSTEAWEWNTGH